MSTYFHSLYPGNLFIPRKNYKVFVERLIVLENFKPGDINVIFCDNRYIFKLNIDYLKHYYPTDVITFDYSDKPVISGDIFIGIDVVKSNALKYQTTFSAELLRVILHGVLHLCGYRDKTVIERRIMRKKEDYYLKMFLKT